ncbi:MAG: SDR family oxidoreductase [Acidimicrobiales bacterium]
MAEPTALPDPPGRTEPPIGADTPPGPAVVVGGASGIGAALAARHRASATDVVVWDRRPGGGVDVVCDIADPAAVDAAIQATVDRVGAPGRVSVTAGIGHAGFLTDVDADEWDHVFAVNVRGAWAVLRGFARVVLATGGSASFVAVSSVSGSVADRSMGTYCASKAALDMLVRVAAAEWGPKGIRVNAVAPGVTRTPMLAAPEGSPWLAHVAGRTALRRLGSADEVAAAIEAVHGLGWVTGQVLACDGGLSLHSPIDPLGG